MSNPAFNERIFDSTSMGYSGNTMTIQGAVNKAFILTGLLLATATFTWYQFFTIGASAIGGWLILGLIGGLISGLVICFVPTTAPVAAPIYALSEGLFIGAISAYFETRYPGVVFPAVALTMGVLVSVLVAYKARLVQATEKFRAGVIAATMAIALVYLVSILLSVFTGHPIPMIHDGGPIGIIFSLVCVVVASMNLVLDFDLIERGEATGAPKYMEWYSAFGLLVTLVWLYLEMLKLLAKLQKR